MMVAFAGGGSLTWIPELATDLALAPEIHSAALILQDTNPQSPEPMLPPTRMVASEAESRVRVPTASSARRPCARRAM